MAIPFELVHDTLVVVPVDFAGREARFVIDTGAGLDAISPRLMDGLDIRGSFSGERMSGEVLTVDLVDGVDIELGTYRHTPDRIGVHPIFDQLPAELGPIDGALSLRYFEHQPFTLDYAEREVRLEVSAGSPIPLRVETDDDVTLSVFVPAVLDGRVEGSFLVDTGASFTVVNEPAMEALAPDGPDVEEGRNETGHPYRRTYATIREIAVGATRQAEPRICFEAIRYDGAIGADFFRDRVVTIDVPARQLTLA